MTELHIAPTRLHLSNHQTRELDFLARDGLRAVFLPDDFFGAALGDRFGFALLFGLAAGRLAISAGLPAVGGQNMAIRRRDWRLSAHSLE